MTRNTSSAVMQQRQEARDALDDFPTPPWATRALCEWLQNEWDTLLSGQRPEHAPTTWPLVCREPAANRGHMVRPLREYFCQIEAADVHDYGAGFPVQDYLFGPLPDAVDWTITNPPFRLAEQFVERAIATSRRGVAVFVRSAFLEGVGRHDRLFNRTPPTDVLQFSERVVIHKGRLAPEGSSAVAYCWLVWGLGPNAGWGAHGTVLHWIPPCRRRLERPEDYQ